MRPTLFALFALTGLIAAPAFAQPSYNAPSFYYQAPDGSYDTVTDLSRSVWGVPCGMECTRRAEIRWGLRPAHPRDYSYNRD